MYKWFDSTPQTSSSSSSPDNGLGCVSQAPWLLRNLSVKYLMGWSRRLATAQRTLIERHVMWESRIGRIKGLSGFTEVQKYSSSPTVQHELFMPWWGSHALVEWVFWIKTTNLLMDLDLYKSLHWLSRPSPWPCTLGLQIRNTAEEIVSWWSLNV